MDSKQPKDVNCYVYMTLLFHGLGLLIPWNMFITAKDYFVEYKLKDTPEYSQNFLVYLSWASQIPNLVFNWINVFITIAGSLANRILFCLFVETLLMFFTVVLAMVDSARWPVAFFWMTIISVFVLNTLNAIYQNSIYGIGSRLPPKYVGALVLGNNVCGTLVVLLSWATTGFKNIRTSAIYYFTGGVFVLVFCFDTFFALPVNKYYRYYVTSDRVSKDRQRPPFGLIIKQAYVQLYNIFMTFLVSLAVFPSVLSDVRPIKQDFLGNDFVLITCFLTFNAMGMLGNIAASIWQFPGPRVLFIYTTCRLVFIPFFLFCNYQVPGRTLAVWFKNDWVFWAGSALLGWTSGHTSSLGLMYVTGTVAPEHASTAGMLGCAMLVSGIIAGVTVAHLAHSIVS